ncbi:DNA polymerase Y family protein [Nocardia sp. CDC160]|uniref:DNA polymerase Y family protein n=1 Tax=Nocardia sp. CDC160 TaxID=3112166 RepID=UPI002DB8F1D8|nr:DNA polymerase Y family protein [Nocardia sp. CDC160]MEC3913176.1 DNA polymerase Y family protein [Nocardia sp. CDC160]
MKARRVLVVWCPDWPAVAAAAEAGVAATRAVAVFANNRVVACTAVARAEGIRRGLRKREAQGRCPDLLVAQEDSDRDARLFEPVVAAVDATVPGVEVLRPGMLALSARGAARFFGSEEAAAERLVDAVAAVGAECQIGIADELSTAVFAARRATLVPPGKGAEFLAPMPVSELAVEPVLAAPQRVELVDLLHRLGLRRIGDFAALTPAEVSSRFGADAIVAHRCARAVPERPPAARLPAADLTVEHRCDPPIERVDMAAFVGRMLATELHTKLSAAAVACTRLVIHAETEAGDQLSRIWRCAEPLTPDSTADRIRWQLDGWLTRRALDRARAHRHSVESDRRNAASNRHDLSPNTVVRDPDSQLSDDWDTGPNAAVTLLRLEPIEVVAAGALQLGLWGGVGEDEERARRALIRVQSLLGGDAVRMGVLSGGRGPEERITLVPLGDEPVPAADPAQPWPGRLPQPAPALVLTHRPRIRLESADGAPIWVTDRGLFTADPALLHWGSSSWRLTGWAGPWPLDDRWWTRRHGFTARAQVQIHTEDVRRLRALLLLGYDHAWHVEGLYE